MHGKCLVSEHGTALRARTKPGRTATPLGDLFGLRLQNRSGEHVSTLCLGCNSIAVAAVCKCCDTSARGTGLSRLYATIEKRSIRNSAGSLPLEPTRAGAMGPSASPTADGEKHLSPTSSDTTGAAADAIDAPKQQPESKRSVFDPRRRNALRGKLPTVIKGPLNGEQSDLILPGIAYLRVPFERQRFSHSRFLPPCTILRPRSCAKQTRGRNGGIARLSCALRSCSSPTSFCVSVVSGRVPLKSS